MELNEIKNQLASLMNFGKISVNSGTGNDAFAQMLNRGDDAGQLEVREENSANAAAKSNRSERREVRSDDKSSVSEKKNKPAKNDKPKADNKIETSPDNVANMPRENAQSQQDEKISRPDNQSTPVDEVPAVETPAVDAAPEDNGNETEKLTASILVPLADLSMMGVINVINPETGETLQMTGAELAAQLAGDDSVQVLMSTPQDSEPVFSIQPVDNAQNLSAQQNLDTNGGIDVSALPQTDDAADLNLEAVKAQVQDKAAKKDVLTQEFADDFADDEINKQAAKLSEIIGNENKADIKVSVNEEKIAQLSAKDLLADVESVDEAITVSSKPSAVSAQNGVEMQTSSANQVVVDNGVQNLDAAPAFNAAIPMSSESGMTNAAVSAHTEVGSAGLETATAVGGEFVRAAKADAASENGQTSFRDVYKGMSKEVIEQVKVNITKSAVKGIDKIDITLKPEDLGHIEVKMQIGKDGKLQAHIISTRPETMEVLQKEMQSLEKAFNDAGFQTDEGSLSFSFRDGNQANQNQERENGLRRFIGDIFEKEAGNDLMGDAFQNQSWNGATGLNIRV